MHQVTQRWLRKLGLAHAAVVATIALPLGSFAQTIPDPIPTVSCAIDPAIFNTGIDGSNGYSINSPKKNWLLKPADDHWAYLPSAQDITKDNVAALEDLTFDPATVNRTNAGNGAWVQSPFGNAEWLGAEGKGTPYYIYRYKFNLDPAVDPKTFNLKFDMYTDDYLRRVFVNGQLTHDYSSLPTGGIGGYKDVNRVSVVLNSEWKAGLNTLYLLTRNNTDPTGLLVQSTGTAACSPPLYVTKQAVNSDGSAFTGKAAAGAPMYYDITVTNASNTDASETALKDSLPSGLQTTPTTWVCRVPNGSAAICPTPPAPNTSPLNVALPVLPAGSSLIYRVNTQFSNPLPANQSVITNTAEITPPATSGLSCDARDGFPTPCSSSASVGTAPLVSVAKTVASAGPLFPGDTAVYTVTVKNEGAIALANTVLNDTLPPGFASASWTCQSPVGSQAVCPAASGTLSAGDSLNQTIAEMKANASLVYTITATVDAVAKPMPSVVNTAQVTASEADALCLNPANGTTSSTKPCTANATVALSPLPQLALTKMVANTGTYYPGQTVTYTITASNAGQVPVANAKITDNLPVGLIKGRWICTPGANTPCPAANGPAPLDASLATFAPGDTLVFTVTAEVATQPPASITNTANLDADAKNSQCMQAGAPVGTVPCTATQTIQAADTPSIAISKTVDASAPVSPGDTLVYTVTVRNSGTGEVTQLSITDPAPAHVDMGAWSCTATGTTCPADTGTGALSATVPVLPAGASLAYTLNAQVSAQAPVSTNLVNEASATSTVAATVCEGGTPLPCKATATVTTKPSSPTTATPTPVPANHAWALLTLTTLLLAAGWALRHKFHKA